MNVAQPWLIDEDSAVQNISPIERAQRLLKVTAEKSVGYKPDAANKYRNVERFP